MLATPLAPLAAFPHFIAWRVEDGRKLPYSPVTGRLASTVNPADWSGYDAAAQFAASHGMAGVGFVFTESDPFFFLDVDKALHDGQWSQLAQELCARFAGAAIEVSQSGTGLHIFGTYQQRPSHRNKNTPLGVELYTAERFVALTGSGAIGSAAAPMDAALSAVIHDYFDPASAPRVTAETWTTEAAPEWRGPDSDDELIALALRSKSHSAAAAFGPGQTVTFADLWTANTDVLAARWPGNSGPYDASSADQALANLLAFWAGHNCERMERLMRRSALARDKWDDRPDYLETTILKAAAAVTGNYSAPAKDKPAPPPPAPASAEQAEATGMRIRETPVMLGFDGQMDLFKGCVYIIASDKILIPEGQLLNKSRFDVVYGGREFVSTVDGRKTTASAWDAYTLSQSFVPSVADRVCFRPERPEAIISTGGLRLANTYVPIKTPAIEGDPTPYLDLLAKQLPDAMDRAVLLNYMASCVQNPGMKAQYWPVIQGAEGNGKTVHITVMVHALGLRYCHLPNVDKMIRSGMNFNGWVDGALFVGLEEVYAADRRSFFEAFKTTVTNRMVPIERKGVDEMTGDNRANGIITTNHQDGVPIDDGKRRYAALFTRQQEAADLTRDGMTAHYFSDLYDWLYGRGAYADRGEDYGLSVVNHYLKTFPLVAELDPNQLATRAPVTSSTARAVSASLGTVEQVIMEAVGQEMPGFKGGWISSAQLDLLLERKKHNVSYNRRREILRSLGYDWHPALAATQGRVNNIVAPDNTKPKLFCKVGSVPYLNISEPAHAARAYSDAQGTGGDAAKAFGA